MSPQELFNRLLAAVVACCCCLLKCVAHPWTLRRGVKPRQGQPSSVNMLYIPWIVILGDCNIKKKVSKTLIFELPKVRNSISRLCTGPFTRPLLVETVTSRLWHGIALGKATDCQNRPFVS